MNATPIAFHARVSLALADPQLRTALDRATTRLQSMRTIGLSSLPNPDAARDRARRLRAQTLSRLDTHLEAFERAVLSRGGKVHFARDAREAAGLILDLARARDVRRVVKSKSMVSEEIGLNAALEAAGIEVVESDLGEYIVQLAGETPSHIIAPAFHKTKEQIGQLLHEKLGIPLTDDPAIMMAAARSRLREVYLTADMGISGVNFGVAETGTLCVVTNEGNASLATSAPKIHVALMGIERLVPTMTDLSLILPVLVRSATGQKVSTYLDFITGPRREEQGGDPDGPDELHVVLVDNGRSKVLGGELAEILYCIRCGACLNACPVYREIGGHAYGSVYSGPIGAVLTPALHGKGQGSELPHASSLCGACKDVCPVRIDIPRMLVRLRNEAAERGELPISLKLGLRVFRLAATRPWLFAVAAGLGRIVAQVFASKGFFTRLPGPLSGWTAHRDLRGFAREPFSKLLAARRGKRA